MPSAAVELNIGEYLAKIRQEFGINRFLTHFSLY